jgi:NTE family protein
MLGPGPEDLQAIGVNMMDARRRVRVFETALRTTAAALRGAMPFDEIRLPDDAGAVGGGLNTGGMNTDGMTPVEAVTVLAEPSAVQVAS